VEKILQQANEKVIPASTFDTRCDIFNVTH